MFKFLIFTLVLVLTFNLITSNEFLKLLNKCDAEDGKFGQCATNEANRHKKFCKRCRKLHGYLKGMDTFKATDIKLLWNGTKFTYNGFFDKLELQSNCIIVGNVLDKSLNGNGSIKIVMDNVDYYSVVYFKLGRKEDNGKYARDIENQMHLSPKKITFSLSGILDDVTRDEEFNKYINENVTNATKELLPIVETVILSFVKIIQRTILRAIPYKNFFINYN